MRDSPHCGNLAGVVAPVGRETRSTALIHPEPLAPWTFAGGADEPGPSLRTVPDPEVVACRVRSSVDEGIDQQHANGAVCDDLAAFIPDSLEDCRVRLALLHEPVEREDTQDCECNHTTNAELIHWEAHNR
jgi:hypothetical protein